MFSVLFDQNNISDICCDVEVNDRLGVIYRYFQVLFGGSSIYLRFTKKPMSSFFLSLLSDILLFYIFIHLLLCKHWSEIKVITEMFAFKTSRNKVPSHLSNTEIVLENNEAIFL